MEPKGLFAELRTAMEQYRLTLSPGTYLFAPEVLLGKMTGRIIEQMPDPAGQVVPAEFIVTFGFYPLGFVPKSLKGAPPSWISEYPFLLGLEQLAEAPRKFLEQLKGHVEERILKQVGSLQIAGQEAMEEGIMYSEDSP